ncbi:radical SAM protein [Geobacter sp. SVR]|nr:radical SAM protein [Geobacter sp. SVR]
MLCRIAAWRCSGGDRPLEVAFFGGSFSALDRADQWRLLEPLQSLIENGAVSGVRISTRPDAVDAETVVWLAERGVTTIELGVQSMDDGVLEAAGRGHRAEASEAAIRCVRAGGLAAGAQLMPGLPGDTPALALSSLEKVMAAGAGFVRLYPVVVLKGTELARRYLAGEYRPLSASEGISCCKVLLWTAMKRGIEIIRIGLQADQGLNAETVLAGCWHPALGQLVRSELYFDLLVRLASGLDRSQPITVKCHPSRVSDVIGQGRSNVIRLRQQGLDVRTVLPEPALTPPEIELLSKQPKKGSLLHDLVY